MSQRNIIAIACGALFVCQLVATFIAAGMFQTPKIGLELAAIGADLSLSAYAYLVNLPLAASCLFLSIAWYRRIDGFAKSVPIALTAFSFAMVIPPGHFIFWRGSLSRISVNLLTGFRLPSRPSSTLRRFAVTERSNLHKQNVSRWLRLCSDGTARLNGIWAAGMHIASILRR